MIPAGFDYHAPATIGEATALLSRLGDDAKVLSGGQSLIPLLKLRLASPRHLVDINRIPGLAYVKEAGWSDINNGGGGPALVGPSGLATVQDGHVAEVVEAAEECPGECIFIEV